MKKREIICNYQPYILRPPVSGQQLRENSTKNDSTTINHWEDIWLNNIAANKEHIGSFSSKGLQSLYGKYRHRPVILAGSGPSLKFNAEKLKDRNGIPLISCLHNFHYFEDIGVNPDFYVSLDAGPIVVSEVSKGGKLGADEYWERTKEHTLVAFIGSDPELVKKWKGDIHFYNCPIPSKDFMEKVDAIEHFHTFFSTGGNVLGAALYLAKAFLGCGPVIFMGADFSFGYDDKFHSWDDDTYDTTKGYCIKVTDVFGNRVDTWQSYKNFKDWFDWVAINVPGFYINASEGGTMGAYPDGNLAAFRIMDLADAIEMFNMSDRLQRQALEPEWNGDLRLGTKRDRPEELKGFNYVLY